MTLLPEVRDSLLSACGSQYKFLVPCSGAIVDEIDGTAWQSIYVDIQDESTGEYHGRELIVHVFPWREAEDAKRHVVWFYVKDEFVHGWSGDNLRTTRNTLFGGFQWLELCQKISMWEQTAAFSCTSSEAVRSAVLARRSNPMVAFLSPIPESEIVSVLKRESMASSANLRSASVAPDKPEAPTKDDFLALIDSIPIDSLGKTLGPASKQAGQLYWFSRSSIWRICSLLKLGFYPVSAETESSVRGAFPKEFSMDSLYWGYYEVDYEPVFYLRVHGRYKGQSVLILLFPKDAICETVLSKGPTVLFGPDNRVVIETKPSNGYISYE